jgi:hypothetical protein
VLFGEQVVGAVRMGTTCGEQQTAEPELTIRLRQATAEALAEVYPPPDQPPTLPTRPAAGRRDPPLTVEAIRGCLASLTGRPPDGVSAEEAGEVEATLHQAADEAASRVLAALDAYVALFQRLGLGPHEVLAYIRRERRLIAELYFAAREPKPSPDRLRRLGLQLAVDARLPVDGRLERFVAVSAGPGFALRVYPTASAAGVNLPPPTPPISAFSPRASLVLPGLVEGRVDADAIVGRVETLFGRAPEVRDAQEVDEDRELTYAITDDRLQLWVAGVEVTGIEGRDAQKFLKYFCPRPGIRKSGRELERLSSVKITNASQTVGLIRARLGSVTPAARNWLLTRPLRWADGVRIRRAE